MTPFDIYAGNLYDAIVEIHTDKLALQHGRKEYLELLLMLTDWCQDKDEHAIFLPFIEMLYVEEIFPKYHHIEQLTKEGERFYIKVSRRGMRSRKIKKEHKKTVETFMFMANQLNSPWYIRMQPWFLPEEIFEDWSFAARKINDVYNMAWECYDRKLNKNHVPRNFGKTRTVNSIVNNVVMRRAAEAL